MSALGSLFTEDFMSLRCIDPYGTDGLLLFRSKSAHFQIADFKRVKEKAKNIIVFYLDFNWEFRFNEPKLRIFCEMPIRKPRQSVKTVGADWLRLLARENYSPAVQVTEASMMPDFSPVALFTK